MEPLRRVPGGRAAEDEIDRSAPELLPRELLHRRDDAQEDPGRRAPDGAHERAEEDELQVVGGGDHERPPCRLRIEGGRPIERAAYPREDVAELPLDREGA